MTGLVAAACCWLASTTGAAPEVTVQRIALTAMAPTQAVELYERVLGTRSGARITASPKGDGVLLEDSRERVSRFRQLIAWLDIPGRTDRRVFVRPVKHRTPSELASVTRRVFGETLGRDVGLAPDDRSSQLIVLARPGEYTEIDRLLRRLDIPPRDERRIFVLPGKTSLPIPGKTR